MLLQDIKYAVRTLTRKPGFAAITILTLAVGIGGNAAIFSAVRAVLLRPLPFPGARRARAASSRRRVRAPERAGGSVSPPDFTDWRRDSRRFTEIAAINANAFALDRSRCGRAVARRARHRRVLQRARCAGDRTAARCSRRRCDRWPGRGGARPLAVVTTLRRRSGSASVERSRSTASPSRIVGVMPRGFAYPLDSELWLPQRFTDHDLTTQRGAHYLDVIGRLTAGVSTRTGARGDARASPRGWPRPFRTPIARRAIAVHEMRDALVGDVRTALLVLLGAVGFVLLIVCVNVANLVLTRALGRTRELAVRTALGAGRVRLVRGVLVESLCWRSPVDSPGWRWRRGRARALPRSDAARHSAPRRNARRRRR